MKKIIQLGVVLGLLLSLAACGTPAAEKWSENMQVAMEAFGESLRGFGDLDADASDAEVEEAIAQYEAAKTSLLAVAAEEGVDISGLEQALDEMEQQIRSASASGEPLEFQQDFLSSWSDAMSEYFDLLGG